MSSPWERVIEEPEAQGHLVQIYDRNRDSSLIRNAARFMSGGLRNGDSLLVIANSSHLEAFRDNVEGCDSAVREGRAAFFNSQEMLGNLMANGHVEWRRFESAVGAALRQVRGSNDAAGVRAYGDMVDILWNARQYSAAIRLEQFWNKLLARSPFSLFCAYSMDLLGADLHLSSLDAVLSVHSHLVPAESDALLEMAVDRAMKEVLGPRAAVLRLLIKANYRPCWAVMPAGERIALWLRSNLPQQSDEILGLARQHYHALSAE